VAGLIASFQGTTLSASWQNSLNPLTSTCYIHDLQWEQINSIRGEYRTETIVTSDSDIEISVDRETELCVAAAHQYELEMQVDAALDALRSKSIQFAQAGTKLFQSYSPSPTLLMSSIACQCRKLLESSKIPDSLPLTVVASDDNQDFDCDWNCVSAEIESVPVASSQVGLDKQINQVGIDPVCPEQWSNHEITWNDCFSRPLVCCPLDTDVEAIGVEPKTLQATTSVRPPTLEAELPFLDTHRLAVDYAFTGDSAHATESGSQMTKGIASQIRTVGQFLVDFANQIESQLDQVEIARRDSNSR